MSTHDWLPMNLRSGLVVQMKRGHVAWESGSCYGGASLAAGGQGAFQSWLGYTIRGDEARQREKGRKFQGSLRGAAFAGGGDFSGRDSRELRLLQRGHSLELGRRVAERGFPGCW